MDAFDRPTHRPRRSAGFTRAQVNPFGHWVSNWQESTGRANRCGTGRMAIPPSVGVAHTLRPVTCPLGMTHTCPLPQSVALRHVPVPANSVRAGCAVAGTGVGTGRPACLSPPGALPGRRTPSCVDACKSQCQKRRSTLARRAIWPDPRRTALGAPFGRQWMGGLAVGRAVASNAADIGPVAASPNGHVSWLTGRDEQVQDAGIRQGGQS